MSTATAVMPNGKKDEDDVVKRESTSNSTDVDVNEQSGPEYITGFQLYAVVAAVTLTCFVMLLDTSIIGTAIPKITDQFHSLKDLGWYVSAYQLSSAAFQPLIGKFFTYFKSKQTFIIFVAIFELGSIICGAAVSSNMLIVGRAVAGLGGSGLVNGALTIIASVAPIEKRPALIGGMFGFAQMGIILGPLIGGAFTEYTTWRWCFFINLPLGALAILAMLLCKIPEQIPKEPLMKVIRDKDVWKKFDITGAMFFAIAIIQLLLALQYGGNQYAWNSSTIIGLFCGAGATAAVFLWWEYRSGDHAMIPFSIFKNRIIVFSILSACGQSMSIYIPSYFLPVYFQATRGASPFISGVYLLPNILSQLLFAVSSGILIGKLGYYLPWSVWGGALISIGAGLITTFSPTTSTGTWIGYQIILGSGRGSVLQIPSLVVQNSVQPSQISTGMALIVFAQNLAASVFVTISNTIFDNSLKSELASKVPDLDGDAIVAAGATGFRAIVPADDISGVVDAFADSFDRAFYVALTGGIIVFLTAWGLGWKDIRKKKGQSSSQESKKV